MAFGKYGRERKDFLYSRLMCWVAMDRAIKIANKCSFPYPAVHWHEVRDDIFADIFENFWDDELKSFVQYKGSKAVDASTLMMPIVGFISPYSELLAVNHKSHRKRPGERCAGVPLQR